MSSFTDLADTFLQEEFAESPVLASSLGGSPNRASDRKEIASLATVEAESSCSTN